MQDEVARAAAAERQRPIDAIKRIHAGDNLTTEQKVEIQRGIIAQDRKKRVRLADNQVKRCAAKTKKVKEETSTVFCRRDTSGVPVARLAETVCTNCGGSCDCHK